MDLNNVGLAATLEVFAKRSLKHLVDTLTEFDTHAVKNILKKLL